MYRKENAKWKCPSRVFCTVSRIQNPALHMHTAKEEREREGEETSAPEMVPPPRKRDSEPRFARENIRFEASAWRKTCKLLADLRGFKLYQHTKENSSRLMTRPHNEGFKNNKW